MHEVLPVMAPRDAPVALALARAVARVLGREPEFVVSPGTYDQKHVDRIGRLRTASPTGRAYWTSRTNPTNMSRSRTCSTPRR